VKKESLEVTDDVSVIEALGKPVKLTLGEYTNIKLTTPDDLAVAEQVLRDRGVVNAIEAASAPPSARQIGEINKAAAAVNNEAKPKKKFIGF